MLQVRRHERVVVCPGPLGEQASDVAGTLGVGVTLEQVRDHGLHLAKRLPGDVGEDQCLVFVLHGQRRHLDQGRRRILAELRVDRAERGVTVKHDLVGGKRDRGAAAHRVVRDDGDDTSIMVAQRPRDLTRREDEAAACAG